MAYAGAVVGPSVADVYTCPPGKRAVMLGTVVYNGGATNSNVSVKYKTAAGSYYRLSGTGAVGPNATRTATFTAFVIEAGESFAVETSAGSLNTFSRIVEFDASATGLKTYKLLAPVAGNNTLYTVPAGKSAFVLDNNLFATTGLGGLFVTNDSGAARTYNVYVVPDGRAVGAATKIKGDHAVAHGSTDISGI
ncbi:MAG: hypothetical protein ACRD9R_09725, partial [Pyrinomonadaceae bacterium]